jgi:hypothetical protein
MVVILKCKTDCITNLLWTQIWQVRLNDLYSLAPTKFIFHSVLSALRFHAKGTMQGFLKTLLLPRSPCQCICPSSSLKWCSAFTPLLTTHSPELPLRILSQWSDFFIFEFHQSTVYPTELITLFSGYITLMTAVPITLTMLWTKFMRLDSINYVTTFDS